MTALPDNAVVPMAPMLKNAELIHSNFRRAREAAKRLRTVAVVLELGVVSITLFRLIGSTKSLWLPLAVLSLTVMEVVARQFVERMRAYAQRCRRVSMASYANEIDVDPEAATLILEDMPQLASWLKPQRDSQSLCEYYDFAATPKGESRMRSICAYSAFFSSRLLRWWSVILLGLSLSAFVAGLIILYELAINPDTLPEVRIAITDALFTVVWWYIVIRVWEAFWKAASLAQCFHNIFQKLVHIRGGTSLLSLIEEYNFERAAGYEAPTWLYNCRKKSLEKEWGILREPLN